MEQNEICMAMDVKMEVHEKRAESLRFKKWQRCEVKIEAIKCLPCFLRLTFNNNVAVELADAATQQDALPAAGGCLSELVALSIHVPVPGVSISLAASRTKQHSYGLFWTHNRRNNFIYFALDTQSSCRRHMKWLKKSIKNLELHRQVCLEQRRLSRGAHYDAATLQQTDKLKPKDFSLHKSSAMYALSPLHKLPAQDSLASNVSTWSRRISRASEIYEEIFEVAAGETQLARRLSNASIASGIYEEMKPSASNFNAILEEPPQLPPRKRFNTLETDVMTVNEQQQQQQWLCELPRCKTNPETEVGKKLKCKNLFENMFQGVRSKRAASVSSHIAEQLPAAAATAASLKRQITETDAKLAKSKRNSFSSPDLSKINFLDTFDESKMTAPMLQHSLDLSGAAVDMTAVKPMQQLNCLEELNVSEQISSNFNFSAINCSSINLMGANVANLQQKLQKNKILLDDLTGYCFMAPIVEKPKDAANELNCIPSTTTTITTATVGAVIYENMQTCKNNKQSHDSTVNLYENLSEPVQLTTSTPTDSPLNAAPHMDSATASLIAQTTAEEEYYQTPRKSIISVDEKISSYYPNSCDTLKMRRTCSRTTPKSSEKQQQQTTAANNSNSSHVSLRHLVKCQRERKENLYISSPQKLLEQRKTSNNKNNKQTEQRGSKKLGAAAAQKIAENVYTVKHALKKTSSHNEDNTKPLEAHDDMQQKLQVELLHLAMFQQIDFKFDDSNGVISSCNSSKEATPTASLTCSPARQKQHLQINNAQNVDEENTATAADAAVKQQTRSASPLSADLQMIRKFASLPRFKKFDLSPLRLKINNVLQRNGGGNQDL